MADTELSIMENGKKRSHSDGSDTDRDSYDQQNHSPKTDVTCAHLPKRVCLSGDSENTHLENGETEVTEAGDPGVISGDSSSTEPNTMIPSTVENAQLQSIESADVHDFDNASTPSITEDGGGLGDLLDLLSSSDAEDEPKEGWRPTFGPISWVQRQMMAGENPRDVLLKLVPDDTEIPDDFDELTLWKIIINLVTEPPVRKKLDNVNTIEDALHLLKTCSKIMVLTGAGVSVSCGIPDFRSRDGIYARLSVEYPDLPDPQAMFDIRYFCHNPRPFFKFAKEIYPGQFRPSTSHKFIKLLEDHGKLLRNYTQNIDTLEQVAGIHSVIQCHGSFATASCMVCKNKVDSEVVKEDIMNQVLPHCEQCPREDEEAIMKPDIVFFGESLPTEFHSHMDEDKGECDLLIVIGSSLKVRPVALIPQSLPPGVPQILINREPLRHLNFDVELLGDCDVIINELCHRLGPDWTSICTRPWTLRQVTSPTTEEAADAQEERGRESSVGETEVAKTETETERKEQGRERSAGETMLAETETECKEQGRESSAEQTEVAKTETETERKEQGRERSAGETMLAETETECKEQGRESSAEQTEVAKTETETERKGQGRESSAEKMEVAKTKTETEPKAETNTRPTESGSTAKEDFASTDANSATTEHQIPATASTSSCSSSKTQESSADKNGSESLENGPSQETFLFEPPSRYIFEGAENYKKRGTDNIWSSSSSGSSSSSSVSGISMDSSSPGTPTKDPQPSGSTSSSLDSHDNEEPSASSEQQMNDETERRSGDTDSQDSDKAGSVTSTLHTFSENYTSEDLIQQSSTTDVQESMTPPETALSEDCCSSSSSGDKCMQIDIKEQSEELKHCDRPDSPKKESSLDNDNS